jgi:hypothetical protein
VEQKELYNNKFSIAHPDSMQDDNYFYNSFTNSSQQYKNEIYDIFFGGSFLHRDVTYSDTMGATPSDIQYKNLLKIQEKYGVGISLTLNEMNRPFKMLRPDIVKDFIVYIKKFYDDGVRSCTISHTHLMRTGALQTTFPDMDWKNTVNHGIMTTQEFVDYTKLGYTTIQLDRNFNRNMSELKRVKKEADRLGVKTCLLIKENCMPKCPFKTEHDIWQGGEEFRNFGKSYWEVIGNTCNYWQTFSRTHDGVANPRVATDIICHSSEDWASFSSLVDVFKRCGRLDNYPQSKEERLVYFLEMTIPENIKEKKFPPTSMYVVDSFKDIYENNLAPIHMWFGFTYLAGSSAVYLKKDYPIITDIEKIKEGISHHFWNRKESKTLAKVLKNCNNQCYKCHMCDDVFGMKRFDSLLELVDNYANN